ncbi:MAG: SRPBCC family protein [Micrococcales bacterium]|nr:SRPBCC family protein [Micrococcales bacterium]
MATQVRDLEASIDIAAAPGQVWAVVSDIRRTGEWSPECRRVLLLGPRAVGTPFVGINQRGLVVWPTTSTITALEEGRRIAWRVNENGSTWSYTLEPTATGTRVVQRRETPDGVSAFAAAFTGLLLGGNEGHGDELERGMQRGLERIKAIVEQA